MDGILLLQALIQGIVQGITEFLPVSSTGHMILVDRTFLRMDEQFSRMFEVVIQLGSILAVVVYFRKKIFDGLFRFDFRSPAWRLWFKVLPAVVPALIVGALFGSKIQKYCYNPLTVAAALFVGGIVLILIDGPVFARKKEKPIDDLEKFSYVRAVGVGLAQCVAMIPGVSRSAATIVGGMGFGCSRALAAEFSFFLAIPTMAAASGYSLLKDGFHMNTSQWLALGVGFLTAFFVAWGVVAWFMDFIRKHDFKVFGWYRIFLGGAILLYFFHK